VKAALAVLLALAFAWGRDASSFDADTLEMVKVFLKMPTAEFPPEHIPRFLAVDPAALPKKLRQPFLAKRLELNTLRRLAEGKKRGGVRMPAEDCAIPKYDQGLLVKYLLIAGFKEISDDEEKFAEKQTQCTERDLMCEFSLLTVLVPEGKEKRRRFFLHFRDPIFALVSQYREQGKAKQTNFFGAGAPVCAPRLK